MLLIIWGNSYEFLAEVHTSVRDIYLYDYLELLTWTGGCNTQFCPGLTWSVVQKRFVCVNSKTVSVCISVMYFFSAVWRFPTLNLIMTTFTQSSQRSDNPIKPRFWLCESCTLIKQRQPANFWIILSLRMASLVLNQTTFILHQTIFSQKQNFHSLSWYNVKNPK